MDALIILYQFNKRSLISIRYCRLYSLRDREVPTHLHDIHVSTVFQMKLDGFKGDAESVRYLLNNKMGIFIDKSDNLLRMPHCRRRSGDLDLSLFANRRFFRPLVTLSAPGAIVQSGAG